jgi:hypothetical protein
LITGLETIASIEDLALTMLHETKWDEFVKIEDDSAAGEGGVKKLMKK